MLAKAHFFRIGKTTRVAVTWREFHGDLSALSVAKVCLTHSSDVTAGNASELPSFQFHRMVSCRRSIRVAARMCRPHSPAVANIAGCSPAAVEEGHTANGYSPAAVEGDHTAGYSLAAVEGGHSHGAAEGGRIRRARDHRQAHNSPAEAAVVLDSWQPQAGRTAASQVSTHRQRRHRQGRGRHRNSHPAHNGRRAHSSQHVRNNHDDPQRASADDAETARSAAGDPAAMIVLACRIRSPR